MITLHTIELGNNIIIPKGEFWNLINKLKNYTTEEVEVEEDYFWDLREHSIKKFNELWNNIEDEVWNEYL
ncbi:MAG: hypothetical protein DRH57_04275 [Candidatus Cloacimonadota bacterium]|nr:MAG: hypothetical protein DRH57_04275 [Candidatus Cloacimonadota bacterium]